MTATDERIQAMWHRAAAELQDILAGTKAYLEPGSWRPVPYAAQAPETGVILDGGPLKTCFDRNIANLKAWFELKHGYRLGAVNETVGDGGAGSTVGAEHTVGWESGLPASSWGRMLGGAAHSLRWGERTDLRAIVDAVVAHVKAHQRDDGYCLPYPDTDLGASEKPWRDERRNYDRVNLTRGMVAAAQVGNRDALAVMRRFYDWLYASPYAQRLLGGLFDGTADAENVVVAEGGTAHNGNNGHEGSLLMYFSELGREEDLVQAERAFVQDWFLEASAEGFAESLSHYPYHIAHCYVLLAYQAWLDHHRATGHPKYLAGARGAWGIVRDHFLHIGGSLAICEHAAGTYPPDSCFIRTDGAHHTGETCGSVFWADFNHRLLQLFPQAVTYADEIERSIFNSILHAQDDQGRISYHNRLRGQRQESGCINTCCEVMAQPFIGRLPQYVYSLADDGLFVNLFAASTIAWRDWTLRQETAFPFEPTVVLTLTTNAADAAADDESFSLRIRMPGWCASEVVVRVNGIPAGTGTPGTFLSIDRPWRDGDVVAFELPLKFRTERYHGRDEDNTHPMHALLYGPILMALTGADDLPLPATTLIDRLRPIAGKPLHVAVEGIDGATYLPYWQVPDGQDFTCFPTVRRMTP